MGQSLVVIRSPSVVSPLLCNPRCDLLVQDSVDEVSDDG